MKWSAEPSKSKKDTGAPSICKKTPIQTRRIKHDLAFFINTRSNRESEKTDTPGESYSDWWIWRLGKPLELYYRRQLEKMRQKPEFATRRCFAESMA
jgi:hypothetical protein